MRLKAIIFWLCIGILVSLTVYAEDIPVTTDENMVVWVPVELNNSLKLPFMIDSGASDTQISIDVVLTLFRSGTLTESDKLPSQEYRLADGSVVMLDRFNIRQLQIGNRTFFNTVVSVGNVDSMLLLGQSILGSMHKWSIDNKHQLLVIEDIELPPLPTDYWTLLQ
jgi:aspartyl protease family protein